MISKGKVTAWRGLASYIDSDTGRKHRKSVTRKTKIEARRALRALIASLPKAQRVSRRKARQDSLPAASDSASTLAFLHRWLAFKAREVRPTSLRSYTGTLLHLVPHLGHVPLTDLTALHVEDAVSALLASGKSMKTVASALHTLRMALRQGVRWGALERNVAEQVRRLRTPAARLKVWTPWEARAFLDAAQGHRLYPLFALALSTGMRKGELLGVRWSDVNFERAELVVRGQLVRGVSGAWELGEPKTPASRRTLPLAADMLEILRAHEREERAWHGTHTADAFVFRRSSGAFMDASNVSRVFRMLTRRAGVPRLRFHDLRHTAASLMIRRGVSAKLVSDRLGHADVAFTLRVYTHLYDDQRRDAALSFDQLLAADRDRAAFDANPNLLRQLEELLHALRSGSSS
ncbi:tyrosine-type recombinase/integrase [Deinococcus yavapaiensis]|uniref:Integrase n=1 Tax=Deinococcus yavapaiensis KR-236 TaxID=694435 RepID=A0A318S5K5_9DEIO|nr:site-specific integrase [Deinococcus yavapaiensis]PYE54062.1 integrase [Deinococcus yavapaiensis KR-236]